MTALEILTSPNSGIDAHLDETPLVRWEPCATFAGPEPHTCATCGWLADDHPAETDERDDDAIIVALPTRPALRRAS